ncbi:MAG: lactoylglutathione lyase [Candidatus Riflebacteria bacterium]|nr:lactoylglutathione lyase [Candidatus Riflebacteria bacterium]
MPFSFHHFNFNVADLGRSLAFYREALGLAEVRRYTAPDASFQLAYLGDGATSPLLELTWLRERTEPYNLGDNEFHLAFAVDDFEAARRRHRAMGCVCFENETMGIYFIEDPDGYWIEIFPADRGPLPLP